MSITHSFKVQNNQTRGNKYGFLSVVHSVLLLFPVSLPTIANTILSSLSPSVPPSLQVGLKEKAKDLL